MDICRRQFGAGLLGAMAAPLFGSPATRTKLIVLVLSEQLTLESFDPLAPQWTAGGFRRLVERGSWFPNCQHRSSTFSATGITNLATGAWPAQHGIVADFWYDRPSRKRIAASNEALLATTLAAQAGPESGVRFSVVAMNRSHAALFAGTPAAHLYFPDENGRFLSSFAPPDWLGTYNNAHPLETFHGANWMTINAATDAPPLRTLTYDPEHPQDFLALYKASPYAQTALFDFAAELVNQEKLGQGETIDFLCIIDGSSALLGHEIGARNPLMRQMELQLDRRIETLISQLGATVGDYSFHLAVTAAHGAPPLPAAESRNRMAVNGEIIAQAVEKGLLDTGRHVEKYVYPFLYLDGLRDSEPARLAAGRAAIEQPAVSGYFTAGGACSAHNEWEVRFRNSFHLKRSGDVMLSYRPEYVEEFGAGRGISYGSLYNYDTRVPLFLYGPQVRTGVFETSVEAVDVAPTLSRLLGLPEPSSSVGRVLGEALAL